MTRFDGYSRDGESGLIYVDTVSEPANTINTVISVKELSEPLVTAVDVNDQSKVWILTTTHKVDCKFKYKYNNFQF